MLCNRGGHSELAEKDFFKVVDTGYKVVYD